MVGDIHRLPIQGHFRSLHHLHVVAIELGEELRVIPCFSPGGKELEESILDEQNYRNMASPALRVDLNNGNCIRWANPKSTYGSPSTWLPWRVKPYHIENLPRPAEGHMHPECLIEIIRGLAAFRDHSPKKFSKRSSDKITEMLVILEQKVEARRLERSRG